MPSAKLKWLAWIAGAVVASATVFLLVTEIYPAIHAWRVKMEFDAAAAAAQRDQARAQSDALNSTPDAVIARARSAPPRPNSLTETKQIGLTDEEIAKYSDELAKKCPSGRFSESVCN